MPAGSQSDIVSRLKGALPNGWFQGDTPVLDGVLNGVAWALSKIYDTAAYAKLQTRVSTATDGFLDLISADFFGADLPRKPLEADPAFRARILAQLLLERGTRRALIRVLQLLTGRAPKVFEPARPADTGGYGTTILGYGVAGGYGSLACPYQAFVTAYRPVGQGIPNVGGYGSTVGGYGAPGRLEYANPSLIQGAVTDSDIYAAIDSVKPAATIIWTQIIS
ncbi:hypothetical protein [Zavarzinella formosa]|uniref:hypothetical protein n=1 Tax=Zavarzinella formosa TaxID=360055 RepID=UPI0002D4566A|nr:hypothetical protein [Zavarzinella formosa]